ncbi:hypothetical protein [Nitratireductor thuwali]|uniref:Uncharacterized protein n=1 Tax=Nitratireductor thuwali TaxID=2267699 RepID=A0ABY5MM99_9HYPH|nr:hypothetical protein NTH_03590 [Nitratireductor thuwali]
MILKLLDESIALGLQEEELDILLVRHGPVDLDLLEECKGMHPGFNGSAHTSIRTILGAGCPDHGTGKRP